MTQEYVKVALKQYDTKKDSIYIYPLEVRKAAYKRYKVKFKE